MNFLYTPPNKVVFVTLKITSETFLLPFVFLNVKVYICKYNYYSQQITGIFLFFLLTIYFGLGDFKKFKNNV